MVNVATVAIRSAVSNAYDNVLNAVMLNAGHDLIWAFSHSTEGSCPLCIPWLGRVLSLTGPTTGPVSITDAGGQRITVDVVGTLNEARAGSGTITADAAGCRSSTAWT